MTWRFPCSSILLCVGLAACASTDNVEMPSSEPDARSLLDVSSAAARVRATPVAPTLTLAEFRGTVHEDGRLDLEILDPAEWETPIVRGALREAEQALWCPVRVSPGVRDTVVLTTDPDTIASTPAECGLPNSFPYSTLGTFCAEVTVRSVLSVRLGNLQAELTSITPSVGYNGYTFGASSGAIGTDPSLFDGQIGAPLGTLGLFGYGELEPGASSAAQWVFENDGGAFSFRGRVVATVPERRNGFDDDCDGEIDEGGFADGESCTEGSECLSGRCDDMTGLCASACEPDTWGPDCTPCNCDDGLFCNGAEVCDPRLGCQAGPAPSLDDGVSCTVDTCDEALDAVVSTANDALCDNGLFCDGAETCDAALGCEAGTGPVVDDGVGCTLDTCDEALEAVSNLASDALCDNGLFCDGAETCNAALGCQAGPAPVVDDGVSCTVDTCDEALDVVVNTPNDTLCDNELFCDGSETCDAALDCLAGMAPAIVGDGVGCTVDTCDEALDMLVSTPDDVLCDNGLFCDGSETCDVVLGCQAGIAPSIVDDGVGCTVNICIEPLDLVIDAPSDGLCDNGLLCDGVETCDPVLDCQAGVAPNVDDGDSCTADSCDEVSGQSIHSPLPSAHIASTLRAFAAVRTDGSVVTWGDGGYGGDSTSVAGSLSSSVVQVFSNDHAFAALKSDGGVVAWGDSTRGGDSSSVAALLLEGVVRVFSTSSGFAALKSDGSVVSWGRSGGDSSSVSASLSSGVVEVFSNTYAFAALKSDGSVVTWGGGCCDSSLVAGSLSSGVLDVVSAYDAFAALKSDGSVVTWGISGHGGDSSSVSSLLASGVVEVFSSFRAFAALKADGSVVTWGQGTDGGDSSSVAASISSGVVAVFSTYSAFAALKSDGSVVTWGTGSRGGDSSSVSTSLSNAVEDVFSTGYAFAALKSDGSVVTWGSGFRGGDSSSVSGALSSSVVEIFSTPYAFAALKSDGSLVTWGESTRGGDSSSVAASLSSGVSSAFSTFSAFAALKSNGSVITWGQSGYGGDSTAVLAELSGGIALCVGGS